MTRSGSDVGVALLAPPPGYVDGESATSWLRSPFMSMFVNELARRDVEVRLVSDEVAGGERKGTILVSFNQPRASLRRFDQLTPGRRVLTLWEPPSVAPQLYTRANCAWFGERIALSRSWSSAIGGTYCHWPQASLLTHWNAANPAPRIPCAVIVASSKRSASFTSQYRLRRQVISDGSDEGVLQVFGRGWQSRREEFQSAVRSSLKMLNTRRTPSLVSAFGGPWRTVKGWQGGVESSIDTMRNYQVAVVIENEPSYVSEKLFDALAAGCIPVYVGPRLSDYGIPQGLVVEVGPTSQEVLDACQTLLASDLGERRRAILGFLNSQDARVWHPGNVAKEFADLVLPNAATDAPQGQ